MDKSWPQYKMGDMRGCSHMTSAENGGVQTPPPPPLISQSQKWAYPPFPLCQKKSKTSLPPTLPCQKSDFDVSMKKKYFLKEKCAYVYYFYL